jgi:uncharacterized protein YjbI with pentapeptide repeats
MLTKNLTPFLFGAKVCSRRPPAPEMTLVVRGAFGLVQGGTAALLGGRLAQGTLAGDLVRDGDDERTGELTHASDFADFKLRADVLLRGSCYAPGGRQGAECPVLFRVGAWSKALWVVGPRVWTDAVIGSPFSDPLPFRRMPITYENAFGGPGYDKNPVGKGAGTTELPTVEHAGVRVRARSDRTAPASYGPINPAWPERATKIGKEYGRKYLTERAPFYAEDFDWSYFNAAPMDQRLPGYLRGDEEITLQNLHPSIPVLTSRLPGVRVRAFVKDTAARFREVRMALDTLLAEPDEEKVFLTWRGVDSVKELDLSDVKTVLVASERLVDAELPEAHYKAILEAFEADPFGIKAAAPEGFDDMAERFRREQAGESPPPGTPGLDPVSAHLERKLGKYAAKEQAQVQKAVGELLAKSEGHVDLKKEMEKAVQAQGDTPPVAVIKKPGFLPDVGLRRTMRRVLGEVESIKKLVADKKEVPKEALARIDALERLPHDPRWLQVDPSYTPPDGPISTEEPGPGRDLSEQDLTGRDLSGMDLSGANLEGAILTRAKLSRANLRGARLKRAILYRADLCEADLTRADLTQVNASHVRAVEAVFTGAKLDYAFFEDADLFGATLAGVQGEYPVFVRARLAAVKAKDASLPNADFTKASLDGADFRGAVLRACQFSKCTAERVDMTGAKINGASFGGAVLRGACLDSVAGDRTIWARANLDGADLSFAVLPAGHFVEVSAVGARFFGANLKECRFYRATLDGAELVRANLFSADLRNARLSGTKFNGSSLYDAAFIGAAGAGTDFTGANLTRSTLERMS